MEREKVLLSKLYPHASLMFTEKTRTWWTDNNLPMRAQDLKATNAAAQPPNTALNAQFRRHEDMWARFGFILCDVRASMSKLHSTAFASREQLASTHPHDEDAVGAVTIVQDLHEVCYLVQVFPLAIVLMSVVIDRRIVYHPSSNLCKHHAAGQEARCARRHEADYIQTR
ncbi:hypothetical protein BC629DRAFT_1441252 [Irpex lacteus]|nr:hypothetical protein BC629DRAFT_1441252 [Irpex lacteus]